MFYLEHSDFSILPDPDDPTHWRGVAQTQEGIKTLLALWGTPQDDPEHPLCVFSWSPVPEALVALKTHFPATGVTPFLNATAHRALWDAQKATAWLTCPCPDTPMEMRFDVAVHSARGVQKGGLWAHWRPQEAPLWALRVEDTVPIKVDLLPGSSFFWPTPLDNDTLTLVARDVHSVSFEANEAARFRIAVLSRAPLEDIPFPSSLKDAYDDAQAKDLSRRQFKRGTTAWSQPFFERTVRAFFDAETPDALPQRLENIAVSQYPRLREIAQDYPLDAQRRAWRGAWLTETDMTPLVYALPRVAAEEVIACALSVRDAKKPALSCDDVWAWLCEAFRLCDAFKTESSFFVDEWRHATVSDHGRTYTFEDVRTTLCGPLFAQERGWRSVYALLDRHAGLQKAMETHRDPDERHEGRLQLARSFLVDDQKGFEVGFQSDSLWNPLMQRAFEDPAFLTGLESTGFWETLKSAPNRHPVWEALLERQMLSGLLGKAGVDREYAPPAQHRVTRKDR
jgi:hypothetical protein